MWEPHFGARVPVVLARTPAVVRGAPHPQGRRRQRREEDERPDDLVGAQTKLHQIRYSSSELVSKELSKAFVLGCVNRQMRDSHSLENASCGGEQVC